VTSYVGQTRRLLKNRIDEHIKITLGKIRHKHLRLRNIV